MEKYYVHPREWLSNENDILFAPGDTIYGELIQRGNKFFADCRNGEELIEVLNPNGAYHEFLKSRLTGQTKVATMDFESNYQKLIEQFGNPMPGKPVTSEYVIEECAELIQAIQHARRGRKNANPVKEMAHVYTLLDALCVYWEVSDEEIRKYKQELIDRYLNQPNDGRHIESLTSQTKEG